MASIGSPTATFLTGLAQAGLSRVSPTRGGSRQSGAAGSATLFVASALSLRVGQLNELVDGAGSAQRSRQAAQIKSLINEARAIGETARYSASSTAKVIGTEPNMTSRVDVAMDHGDTITVSDGHTTATYIHSAGFEVQDFIDTVNNSANLNVKASLTADKRLRLEATGVNSITIGGSADAAELASIGLSAGTTVGSVNPERQEHARAFDAVREKIDAVKLEADSGNESSRVTSASLGIRRAGPGGGGDFQSDFDIAAAIADLDRAEAKLADKFSVDTADQARLVRESFTNSAIELLSGEASGVSLSEISDPEAALLAAQTRTRLAAWPTSSISGKAGEPLLRLFQ